MSWEAARVIDFHAHVVLEETFGAAAEHGPELTVAEDGRPLFRAGGYRLHGVRYRGSPFMDVEVRLAAMDRAGIDCQVLSPNPLTYFHFIDVPSAVAFCRRHNDVLAALVRRYPGRLAGLAALPMQSPAAAAEELRRAVGELGLWGAGIGTEFGTRLDETADMIMKSRCHPMRPHDCADLGDGFNKLVPLCVREAICSGDVPRSLHPCTAIHQLGVVHIRCHIARGHAYLAGKLRIRGCLRNNCSIFAGIPKIGTDVPRGGC
jgi:hypothetical protein